MSSPGIHISNQRRSDIRHPSNEPARIAEPAAHELEARVLLIEDDDDCRRYVAHVLEQAGCQVSSVSNGEDGVRWGTQGGYDLILADVSMPKIDGFELTGTLQTVWEELGLDPIPIVALTGHTATDIGARCLSAGMVEHVTKPILPDTLTDVVRRWSGGFRVEVPPDITDLIPGYLARRGSDLRQVRDALARSDFAAVRALGHDMKGSGRPYGFPDITTLGRRLEEAASRQDPEATGQAARDLDDYLQTLGGSEAES